MIPLRIRGGIFKVESTWERRRREKEESRRASCHVKAETFIREKQKWLSLGTVARLWGLKGNFYTQVSALCDLWWRSNESLHFCSRGKTLKVQAAINFLSFKLLAWFWQIITVNMKQFFSIGYDIWKEDILFRAENFKIKFWS